jgi:nitrite transporter NirC
MPETLPAALGDAQEAARAKAAQVRRLPRYLLASALAGAFVGVAVVLLLSVSAPLAAQNSAFTRLVQGSVFGVALTLVVFAGAELFTGNAMTMLQGLWAREVKLVDVVAVWVASLVGNFAGALVFAGLVHGAGTLNLGAAPGKPAPLRNLLGSMITAKDAAPGPQLFWRAVLCNMLVCLGLWMATRTRNDAAKVLVLWWALLAFIASGFEHSIANMTLFGLGILDGSAAWSQLLRNLAWTVPGNLVGGGVVVGLGYAWLGRTAGKAETTPPQSIRAADAA